MAKKKYALCPMHIHNGFDWTFIGSASLMRLYRVRPRDCVTVRCEEDTRGMDQEEYIWLYPDPTGKYIRPDEAEENANTD